MRRVLVYTPDLLFYSQVKGVSDTHGWSTLHVKTTNLPADGVDGDVLVIDATRDQAHAWQVLESVRSACPWLVMVAHQHVHPEVAQEALHRGATEAVRRGILLARLAERLEHAPPARV